MQLNQIIEVLNSIHNGSFHKIIFKSEPKMKASYKEAGFKVIKVTEMVMRTGVNYKAIAPVKESNTSKKRTNNYESVIKNKLLYNTKTNKHYVRVYPYSNVKYTYYIVKGINITPVSDISEYVIPSYKADDSIVLNISIDNIINIK